MGEGWNRMIRRPVGIQEMVGIDCGAVIWWHNVRHDAVLYSAKKIYQRALPPSILWLWWELLPFLDVLIAKTLGRWVCARCNQFEFSRYLTWSCWHRIFTVSDMKPYTLWDRASEWQLNSGDALKTGTFQSKRPTTETSISATWNLGYLTVSSVWNAWNNKVQ